MDSMGIMTAKKTYRHAELVSLQDSVGQHPLAKTVD